MQDGCGDASLFEHGQAMQPRTLQVKGMPHDRHNSTDVPQRHVLSLPPFALGVAALLVAGVVVAVRLNMLQSPAPRRRGASVAYSCVET